MCNLFSNTLPPDAMRSLFDVAPADDRLGNLQPLTAIYPRHEAPVVLVDGGRRVSRPMHWGFLMPQVSKRTGQPILPKAINNARDDKLASSPFWAESFRLRRCLIPATAFCEPRGQKPATHVWFGLHGAAPRQPFAFAGLWRRFRGRYREAEPVEIDTVTMVTTTPNALVATAHPDRMPAILPPEHWAPWLDGPSEAAMRLIAPYPAAAMCVLHEGIDDRSDAVALDPSHPG